jgi:hypothetical protein
MPTEWAYPEITANPVPFQQVDARSVSDRPFFRPPAQRLPSLGATSRVTRIRCNRPEPRKGQPGATAMPSPGLRPRRRWNICASSAASRGNPIAQGAADRTSGKEAAPYRCSTNPSMAPPTKIGARRYRAATAQRQHVRIRCSARHGRHRGGPPPQPAPGRRLLSAAGARVRRNGSAVTGPAGRSASVIRRKPAAERFHGPHRRPVMKIAQNIVSAATAFIIGAGAPSCLARQRPSPAPTETTEPPTETGSP